MKAYLQANPRDRSEDQYLSPRVFTTAMGWVDWARTRQPFALVVDSFDAHEPWDVPKRISDMYARPSRAAWSRSSRSRRRRPSTPGSG